MAKIEPYQVLTVQSALEDLFHIVQYIDVDLQQPLTASRIYQQLRSEIQRLTDTAGLKAPYFDLNGRIFYRHNVKHYAIIYTIENNTAYVVHVYHGLQDIDTRLNDVMDVVQARESEID